jgi:hypothetical protein
VDLANLIRSKVRARARLRALVLLSLATALSGACRQSECARNSDCKKGYCRRLDWRCVEECHADEDCPVGAFCASTCSACLRCDLACVTDPLSGPGGNPPLGACIGVSAPAARCAVSASIPACAQRADAPDAGPPPQDGAPGGEDRVANTADGEADAGAALDAADDEVGESDAAEDLAPIGDGSDAPSEGASS